jgi:hypothetical protein
MPILRQAAFRVLRTAVRIAPVESRRWADAMLAELDHVQGNLPALRWALGSATALCRHSLTHMHPELRLAGFMTSRRGRLAIAGAVLLLAVLAFASSRGVSESRPANGGRPHVVTARVP